MKMRLRSNAQTDPETTHHSATESPLLPHYDEASARGELVISERLRRTEAGRVPVLLTLSGNLTQFLVLCTAILR